LQRGGKNECKLQFQSKVSEFGSEFVVTRGPELRVVVVVVVEQ
jgi:hypothetical protein